MKQKAISVTVLMLLLIGMLPSDFNPAVAGVDETATIRPHGATGERQISAQPSPVDYAPLISSEPPATQWRKTYGGAGIDKARSVQQTADGGYIVAGTTESFGAGSGDFWLVKTNSAGNMQWNKTYGGARWDMAESVQQTADGGYIVAGSTESFGAGRADFWLIKLAPEVPPAAPEVHR